MCVWQKGVKLFTLTHTFAYVALAILSYMRIFLLKKERWGGKNHPYTIWAIKAHSLSLRVTKKCCCCQLLLYYDVCENKQVYKEAKRKKFIFCHLYIPLLSKRGAREPWEQQCEQHSNVHGIFGNFLMVFVLAFSALWVLPNVTHTSAGRPSSSFQSFIPFLTEIDEKRTWKAHNTTLMHTHGSNTLLFSALSLAVYLLPKNIEIIKKFLVVAWIWFTFDYSVFEHLGVNSALKIFYFNFSLNHT